MPESVEAVVTALETAWNAASGEQFAAQFTKDADFVTVFGYHDRGRDSIAANHDMIFHGVYLGSRIQFKLMQVRPLSPDVVLAHLRGELSVPQGPMAGVHEAAPSLVLTRNGSGWRIASLHNTWVTRPPWLNARP